MVRVGLVGLLLALSVGCWSQPPAAAPQPAPTLAAESDASPPSTTAASLSAEAALAAGDVTDVYPEAEPATVPGIIVHPSGLSCVGAGDGDGVEINLMGRITHRGSLIIGQQVLEG